MGAVITGWGSALPDNVVTNADLEARLDTTDEWIVSRSGIRERRIGGTVSSLATEAGRRALERAAVAPAQVDLLVLATCTPDLAVPATSAAVHHALGLSGGAFDVNAACSGFVYGLVAAQGAVNVGAASRVLLIGADCVSLLTDPDDRATAVLFADGAGAVLLEAGDDDGLLAVDLGVDGSAHDLLTCAHGGYMVMEGKEVFRRAVRVTVESASNALGEGRARIRRHRPVRPPPGQPAHHRSSRPPTRDRHGPRGGGRRPDGQYLERLGPPGACRRGRCRPTAPR